MTAGTPHCLTAVAGVPALPALAGGAVFLHRQIAGETQSGLLQPPANQYPLLLLPPPLPPLPPPPLLMLLMPAQLLHMQTMHMLGQALSHRMLYHNRLLQLVLLLLLSSQPPLLPPAPLPALLPPVPLQPLARVAGCMASHLVPLLLHGCCMGARGHAWVYSRRPAPLAEAWAAGATARSHKACRGRLHQPAAGRAVSPMRLQGWRRGRLCAGRQGGVPGAAAAGALLRDLLPVQSTSRLTRPTAAIGRIAAASEFRESVGT